LPGPPRELAAITHHNPGRNMLDPNTLTTAREKAGALTVNLIALHERLADAGIEIEALGAASDSADELHTLLGGETAYPDLAA
jgi:hypothetical protein